MKNIILKGDPIVTEEYSAAEAITPGHLLELASATTVRKNTDDAANVAVLVALERMEFGKGIDDAYAIGDTVKAATFKPGERAYMLLASGQNVAAGAYLTGDTAGLLTASSVAAGVRLAKALEAKNTSGSAPVAGTRIRVEIC